MSKTKYLCGEEFTTTGWYGYAGHTGEKTACFIPPQSNRMLFKKGEKAPMLGSCGHEISWEFISEFSD